MFSREFQSTCLALRSPAILTGNPPTKRVVRSVLNSGREVEKKPQLLVQCFAGQCDSDCISLQVTQTRNGH